MLTQALPAGGYANSKEDVRHPLSDVWGKADDEGKHEILETLFAKFVVDKQEIVDVEIKAPYSWLLRLGCKPQLGLQIPNGIR